MKKSYLEDIIYNRIHYARFPLPIREYRFAPPRRWRFDFAWPDLKLAVEAEGGVWSRGRHTRGSGFVNDSIKYNEAAKMGWTVLKYTTSTIDNLLPDLKKIFEWEDE